MLKNKKSCSCPHFQTMKCKYVSHSEHFSRQTNPRLLNLNKKKIVKWDCFDEKTTTKTNKRWFDWSQIQNSGLGFIRHIRINWEMLRSGHNIILAVSANFYYKNTTACFATKGQLISKGLFAILEFFQKTNETVQS